MLQKIAFNTEDSETIFHLSKFQIFGLIRVQVPLVKTKNTLLKLLPKSLKNVY